MRKGTLTRDQAIAMVGKDAIDELDSVNCEPTSRLQTDGDESTEYSASLKALDKDGSRLVVTAYYYLSPDDERTIAEHDGDGSAVDWVIEGYDID